jgi:hypothetical protein
MLEACVSINERMDRNARMIEDEFITIELDRDHPEHLWGRIETFKRRAQDLAEFKAAQNWGIHNVSVNRTNENRPHISGSLPDETTLELLYRRFRFFILNDKPAKPAYANYRRLLKFLGAATSSELAHMYFRLWRKEFLTDDVLRFAFITAKRRFTPEDVIRFWFNAEYFHDDREKEATLAEFRGIVSDNGAKVALWHAVWDATLRVRNLNWLLKDTSRANPRMHIPHFCRVGLVPVPPVVSA